MANTINLGNGDWATKEDLLLGYNNENAAYKPLPFDFTRASSGTVVNRQGLIETVALGLPRIDFQDNTNGSLLLEPQSTNLYIYSEPTTNEGPAGGVSYESFDWGIGFLNCVKFGDNSTTRYRYGASAVSTTQYTASAFVIMDDLSEPFVSGLSSTGDFSFVIGGSLAYSVNPNVDMGNNIWKISATIPAGVSSGNNGIIKYTNQSNKGFRVVGWQLEQKSYATSLINTQGTTVTRVQDLCNNGGSVSTINSTAGVLYAEIAALSDDASVKSINLAGASTERVGFYYYASSINAVAYSGGSNQVYMNIAYNPLVSNKIAFKYKTNDFALWINGVKERVSVTGNTPIGLNEINFNNNNVEIFFGKTKDLRVYNTALSDQELQILTTI